MCQPTHFPRRQPLLRNWRLIARRWKASNLGRRKGGGGGKRKKKGKRKMNPSHRGQGKSSSTRQLRIPGKQSARVEWKIRRDEGERRESRFISAKFKEGVTSRSVSSRVIRIFFFFFLFNFYSRIIFRPFEF